MEIKNMEAAIEQETKQKKEEEAPGNSEGYAALAKLSILSGQLFGPDLRGWDN